MTDARASEAGTYVVTERLSWRKEGRGTGRVVRAWAGQGRRCRASGHWEDTGVCLF